MQLTPILPDPGFGTVEGFGPLDPSKPKPTTSGTGTPITIAYDDNDWSRDQFLEITGPATSGPIPHAFSSKEDALAAAAGLSHGNQPALAVLFDSTSGPRGSKPWVIQSLQVANPSAVGFIKRNGDWQHTGWDVHTNFLNLETGNVSSFLQEFVAKAPFTSGVAAIVDGAVTIQATKFQS
jgi:hypothetical protein